jgi:hypothetical protein
VRAPLPTLLLYLVALNLSACQSCPQAAQALVARPDFSSAENCAKSFFAALSINEIGAEYKCLGSELKQKYGATLDAYILGRPLLDEQLGSTRKYAFQLEMMSRQNLEDGLELIWWGHNDKRLIGTLCSAQHYFSVQTSEGEFGSLLGNEPSYYLEVDGKHLFVNVSDSIIRSLPDNQDISSFTIASEWKIADFIEPPKP